MDRQEIERLLRWLAEDIDAIEHNAPYHEDDHTWDGMIPVFNRVYENLERLRRELGYAS